MRRRAGGRGRGRLRAARSVWSQLRPTAECMETSGGGPERPARPLSAQSNGSDWTTAAHCGLLRFAQFQYALLKVASLEHLFECRFCCVETERKMRFGVARGAIALSFLFAVHTAMASSLRCAPIGPAEPGEKDPITTIMVSFAGQNWHVTHIAASGAQYVREQQYILRDTSSPSSPSWSGTLVAHPYLTMYGRIINSGSEISYEENVYDLRKGGISVAAVRSNCVPSEPLAQLGSAVNSVDGPAPNYQNQQSPISIALKSEGGTYTAPVQINGAITLDFMVDSGASDVAIPVDVALTLMRTGTLASDDFIGNQQYVTADGRTVPSMTVRIRTLRLGERTISGVVASISPVAGSLLLGESFLRRFRSWTIDNEHGLLVLN